MIRAAVSLGQGTQLFVHLRQHVVTVDQPVDAGGDDTAPTPTELLLGSLASCVAHYARGYLSRHDLPDDGLSVEATAELAQRPTRLESITVILRPPAGFPEQRRSALLAVASSCTVHNTLAGHPRVETTLG